MENTIRYCKRCNKTFSGDDRTSEKCPFCGVLTFDTGISTILWRNMSSEEKEVYKRKFAENYKSTPQYDNSGLVEWLRSSFKEMISVLFVISVISSTIIGALIGYTVNNDIGLLLGIVIGLLVGVITGIATFGLFATIISISDTQKEILEEMRSGKL